MPSTAQQIIDLLEARAHSGRDAFAISRGLFDEIIAILHARFGLNYFESELLLIAAIRKYESVLFVALRDRVHLDDAEDAVRLCLGDEP